MSGCFGGGVRVNPYESPYLDLIHSGQASGWAEAQQLFMNQLYAKYAALAGAGAQPGFATYGAHPAYGNPAGAGWLLKGMPPGGTASKPFPEASPWLGKPHPAASLWARAQAQPGYGGGKSW